MEETGESDGEIEEEVEPKSGEPTFGFPGMGDEMGLINAHAPMVRLHRLRRQRDAAKQAERLLYQKKQRAKRLRKEASPLWNLLRKESNEGKQIALIRKISPEALNYKDGVNNFVCAIHLAVAKERPKVIQALLDHKADINATDGKGHTALWTACLQLVNAPLTKFFLERGADVNAQEKETGQTILHHCANGGYAAISKALIAGKADIHRQDNAGQTALHMAVANSQTWAVKLLVRLKVDPNQQDKKGVSALSMAQFYSPGLVPFLEGTK